MKISGKLVLEMKEMTVVVADKSTPHTIPGDKEIFILPDVAVTLSGREICFSENGCVICIEDRGRYLLVSPGEKMIPKIESVFMSDTDVVELIKKGKNMLAELPTFLGHLPPNGATFGAISMLSEFDYSEILNELVYAFGKNYPEYWDEIYKRFPPDKKEVVDQYLKILETRYENVSSSSFGLMVEKMMLERARMDPELWPDLFPTTKTRSKKKTTNNDEEIARLNEAISVKKDEEIGLLNSALSHFVFDYSALQTPDDYRCSCCHTKGVKLWSVGPLYDFRLKCAKCLAESGNFDINEINDDGTFKIDITPKTWAKSMGEFARPAIVYPTRTIGMALYSGRCDIPAKATNWWKGLPNVLP